MLTLKVSATSHGQNYLPEYFAQAAGGFARRGLTVESWDRDPWTGVIDDLDSGATDLVLGGLWVPAMYAGKGRDLVAVGQLNARFSKVLVTREPVADFDWNWIAGRTILAPGAGGTAPYEFTAGLIRAAGVDPASARFVRDLSGGMLSDLFAHGLGDAIIVDTFTAAQLTLRGTGHVGYRMAGPGGVMPNSVYYTQRDRLAELHERLVPFLAAVQEAMDAITGGADTGDLLAQHWPAAPAEARDAATAQLIAEGVWDGVRIDPKACDSWVAILRDAGLVNTDVDHTRLIDTAALDEAGV
jgi:NitT/TauT family transport system substrate-binding protein